MDVSMRGRSDELLGPALGGGAAMAAGGGGAGALGSTCSAGTAVFLGAFGAPSFCARL